MIYKYKKKLQRKMNRDVRKWNKALIKDEVWRGRFKIRQLADSYYSFEDGSGGILRVQLRAIDKKTNKFADAYIDYSHHFNIAHIGDFINIFIVNYLDVWMNESREDIYNDKTDYTKIKSDYHLDKIATFDTLIYNR